MSYPGTIAATTPDKPAFIMASTGAITTYRELDDRSNQIARMFRDRGLTVGDHIAIFMENNPAFFEICWAAQRSGLYYTAISSRLTAPEAAYIVNDCEARILVTSRAKADVAAELAGTIPKVDSRFMVDGTVDGFESLEEAMAAQPAEPLDDEAEGADMLYSSGTTGRPKGIRVPLSGQKPGSPNPLLMMTTALWGFGQESVYLSPAPFYHSAPLRFNMSVMRLGATSILMEQFDPLEALRLIQDHEVTHSQWVPTMFIRMLKLPEADRTQFDLSSHRAAVHAAAPCPAEVKSQMIEWWGPIIYEYYAGTEGNGFVHINSEEWLAHPGSVGRPILGELHIVDEQGAELPPGEAGTIYFGNAPQFEYHNDPEKTAESRNEQGWSTLGDIGYVDEEGYLYLTDRRAFMIISGGVNIYPQEAENVLVMHPKVADVAVFGVPNDDFGEEVKGVVQPIDMADAGPELEKELLAFCRDQLTAIKCPRSIDFLEELPRHPTGKLYKRLLRDQYWADRQSRI
jgi:long-chain acyl-CoA synthetase